jgi:hypothetical protein
MFGCMQGEWRNAKQGEAVSWKEQEETRCHELWLAYMSTLSLTPKSVCTVMQFWPPLPLVLVQIGRLKILVSGYWSTTFALTSPART